MLPMSKRMELDDVQAFLDQLYHPDPNDRRDAPCIATNASLSSDDVNTLYQIVADFFNKDIDQFKKSDEYSFENFDSVFNTVADIIKNNGLVAQSTSYTNKNGDTTQININPQPLPFLLKQVLIFMLIIYKKHYSITNTEFLRFLKDKGVKLSHNFFSNNMRIDVDHLYKMYCYKQPKLPINYLGQKREELGTAIKNLVYQAGDYDTFIDIFGGSGAASVATEKRKGVDYVYNELSAPVSNMFAVFSDKVLHRELIIKIKELQSILSEELQGEDVHWVKDIDFISEIKTFVGKPEVVKGHRQQIWNQAHYDDFNILFADIVPYMRDMRNFLIKQDPSYTVTSYNEEGDVVDSYTAEWLLDNVYFRSGSNFEYFMSFNKNYALIKSFVRNNLYTYFFNIPLPEGGYLNQPSNISVSPIDFDRLDKRLDVYKFYAYFENLLNNSQFINLNDDDKVLLALAELYHWSFILKGMPDVSPIYAIANGKGKTKKGIKAVNKFIKENFNTILTQLYIRLSNLIVENMDCVDVIKKYQHSSAPVTVMRDDINVSIEHSTPLFYSDSPYAATIDYEGNKVPEFKEKDMKDLIVALRDSGDKFIFSCRAVKDNSENALSKADLLKADEEIFKTVFGVFLDEFNEEDLWVLAIEPYVKSAKMLHTLDYMVANDEVAEIMITNYEIHDFIDPEYAGKVRFKVYTFMDFIEILVKKAVFRFRPDIKAKYPNL